ncbi:galactokinase [Agromyces sp. NPDC058110]|uniref:galactokinase n=1 Tax=Agromyces sp. NPDC058110 TaxID=3346345 RepID=UPI0036DB3181
MTATPVETVTRGFIERHGHEPAGVWSSPGRVNLIGEHTDYNDGFVFPFAIDQRASVALGARDDRVIRVSSTFAEESVELAIDDLAPDAVVGWAAYPLGVAWALTQFGADLSAVGGVDLHIDSTVPVGAGLSSSAAIECSVALALDEHWGLGLDRPTLAKVGQLAENRVVGAPTGILDQSASLLSQADAAVFLDCRSLDAEVIPLGLVDDGLSILVIDTNVSHEHATGGYAARRASCEAGARALGVDSLRDVDLADLDRAAEVLDDETFRRVRHIVTENRRVLDTVRTLREQGAGAIGPLLDASHVSMRDDFEITVPEVDLAVETAQSNGAIGARMTGGGFGGSAIALVIDALVPVIEREVHAAFAAQGYREPTTFVVRPSEGARRDA